MKIPKSTVQKYLTKWATLENYVLQESSLKKLFGTTYPENNNLDDVLIKVCSLNDFYSTNIFSPFMVAKHIVSLNIDKRLQNNDLKLVNDIAKVEVVKGKTKNFYSFSTKYCSHHKPTIYPIYDSYVEKLLMHFKKTDNFAQFQKQDLKDYPKYQQILLQFREFYQLQTFNLKEIDKYLWQGGKKHFPEKYYRLAGQSTQFPAGICVILNS
ncbi:MAG: hypothetical protein JXR53_08350 [Bacteroidales bacterium]|nr:hypothetical protein [Bacteroidales bacterium]